jgi:hypothetical protein
MTDPIAYQPTDAAHLVPLVADPETGASQALDLSRHPHLLVVANDGYGATSALRLVAAHTAAHGSDVVVLAPKRGTFNASLRGAGSITVATDPEEMFAAVAAFTAEMWSALELVDAGELDPKPARRVLVVDTLDALVRLAAKAGNGQLLQDVQDLALMGRAVGSHLVAAVSPFAYLSDEIRDCCGALLLGPVPNQARARFLCSPPADVMPKGRARRIGLGELADIGEPRRVRVAYLDDGQARALVEQAAA